MLVQRFTEPRAYAPIYSSGVYSLYRRYYLRLRTATARDPLSIGVIPWQIMSVILTVHSLRSEHGTAHFGQSELSYEAFAIAVYPSDWAGRRERN